MTNAKENVKKYKSVYTLAEVQRQLAAKTTSAKASKPKKRKYNNTPVEMDGQIFASKKEARVYADLKLLRFAGEVIDFQCQVPYKIEFEGKLICTYVADFVVRMKNGLEEVWDVKGSKKTITAVYRLKKKIMKIMRGIEIIEK